MTQDGLISLPVGGGVATLVQQFSYNYWAYQRILKQMAKLSEAELKEPNKTTIHGKQPKYAKVLHLLSHILFHSVTHRSELAIYPSQCSYSPGDMEFLDFVDSGPS